MKKIDKLGRIVIPSELRQKHGLNEGTPVEIIDIGEGIIVRSSESFCKICHEKISEGTPFSLCEKCMADVAKNYREKKQRKVTLRKY